VGAVTKSKGHVGKELQEHETAKNGDSPWGGEGSIAFTEVKGDGVL